jgi:predicted DNA-binding transcriptional regulator AlpA
MLTEAAQGVKLLRFSELKAIKGIPYSRVHVGRLEKDGKFPKRVHLSPGTVAWVEAEIDGHIADAMATRH